ncbi:MAG TPA: hypothetical protein VMR52_02755 [Dehalococcoidia bacterium]|nr:hypothetical protein [Dehalococcoidia bacterium]
MVEPVSLITEHLSEIVKEIRALNPDRNWLLQHYWIDSETFPEQAKAIASVVAEMVALNPANLTPTEASQRVIGVMVRAVREEHFDEREVVDELETTVAFLVHYQGSADIHLQVQNLVAASEFSLGEVVIVPIRNQGDLTEYNLKYDQHSLRSSDVSSVNAYARVEQAPGLGTAASINAIVLAERVLKVVRGIGLPNLWGRDWGQMGITGRVVGSGWTILRTGEGFWNSSLRTNLTPQTWYMSLEAMLSNYSATEIERVRGIYDNSSRTAVENKVLQALFWLGEATFPSETSAKFAHLSIAFETAVGGEASGDSYLRDIGITQMLAERTAFLLGTNRESRIGIHKSVAALYGSRSKVMHGETEPISEAELTRWVYVVWQTTRAMLDLSSNLATVEDFAMWCRKLRYTLPTSE